MHTPTNSRVAQIRQTIALAKTLEAQDAALARFLAAQRPHLHPSLCFPPGEQALFDFVLAYIEHVPDFIEALREFMLEAGIYDFGQQFLHIAEAFFVSPPELVQEHTGLQALIDEAYLAHRLMEELNDRLALSCGRILAPMDMTCSNLVIHGLLGETFANQLDLAVHYAIEALFADETLANTANCSQWINDQAQSAWAETLRRWPALAGDAAMGLALRTPDEPPSTQH
jgi:hypothetical protein